jgi:hypothetical protein
MRLLRSTWTTDVRRSPTWPGRKTRIPRWSRQSGEFRSWTRPGIRAYVTSSRTVHLMARHRRNLEEIRHPSTRRMAVRGSTHACNDKAPLLLGMCREAVRALEGLATGAHPSPASGQYYSWASVDSWRLAAAAHVEAAACPW